MRIERQAAIVICFLLSVCVVYSQSIQQGMVKTRGRMVNGKLQPGRGLQGTTVQMKERSVVSQNGGTFSFPVPAKTFLVQNVKKQGYQLVDLEMCRNYKYSADPLYLVMETPEQQQADQLAKERNLRRELQRRLQQREDEVESLNVSLEEKNKLLQEINKEREDNEKIIKDLSKYYATLDYDQLDEFQRTVTNLLENGQLEQADSILRSRGSMTDRIRQIQDEQAAEAKEEAELTQRQKDLAISREGTRKRLEDAAADCYSFHQRFLQAHQNDSAGYYLELRAELDTMNIAWQNDAGRFAQFYLSNFPKAVSFYQQALNSSIRQYGEQSKQTAVFYNNLGSVYTAQGMYEKALFYLNRSLELKKILNDSDEFSIAKSYINIGYLYSEQGNKSVALDFYKKALSVYERNSYLCQEEIAVCYANISSVLTDIKKYSESLPYSEKALSIRKQVYGDEHPKTAVLYNNIGKIYSGLGNYSKAIQSYERALAVWNKTFNGYHIWIANAYSNIGEIYYKEGDYAKALTFFEKALDINRVIYGDKSLMVKSYETDLMVIKLALATKNGRRKEYLSTLLFMADVIDGNVPARQQGMAGEYILLEYNNWYVDDPDTLNEKSLAARESPKDILVMKDDVIKAYHFDKTIGIKFGLKQVDGEEKQRINQAYEAWKRQNRK